MSTDGRWAFRRTWYWEILTKQEGGKTVSQSWISDNMRVLDQGGLLFFITLFLAAMAGYGFSFDAGTVTESEAGQRAKLLGVIISFSVPWALAPQIEPAAFGTASVIKAKREAKANPFPPGFDEPRPKGPINGWIAFSAQDAYVTSESDGRGQASSTGVGARAPGAGRIGGGLSDAETAVGAEGERRTSGARRPSRSGRRTSASWLAAGASTPSRERGPPLPGKAGHELGEDDLPAGVRRAAARLTTLALHNVTTRAMDAPDPIKTACAAKATALRRARWRAVRGLLPEALRAGDASAAERCTWDHHRRHVVIDVAANPRLAARQAEARRHLGLATPRGASRRRSATRPSDPDGAKSVFKQTVRARFPAIDVRKASPPGGRKEPRAGRRRARAGAARGARRPKALENHGTTTTGDPRAIVKSARPRDAVEMCTRDAVRTGRFEPAAGTRRRVPDSVAAPGRVLAVAPPSTRHRALGRRGSRSKPS